MQIVIEGLTGSGKSWFQSKMLFFEWKKGSRIDANYRLIFSEKNEDVHRFFALDEIYHVSKSTIGLDEAQDFAGHWQSMPISFRNKIAHQRHQNVDIIMNTQDFNDLHVEIRRNTHEVYRCQSLFRFPKKDRVLPVLQIIRVIKKIRQPGNDDDRIRFKKIGKTKYYFISKFWTKKRYDTYANIDFNKFLCKLIFEKKPNQKNGKWTAKIYSRDLVSRGKARL
jgi:hypothetical protein